MAAKLSLRERARVALGDFSYTEDALREKMAAIYEKDARENGEDDFSIGLHKAVIMRDGNLDAFEVKTKKPALDERTEKEIQAAAHSFAVGYAAMRAEAGKTESPPPSPAARPPKTTSPKLERLKAPEPMREPVPMREPEPE